MNWILSRFPETGNLNYPNNPVNPVYIFFIKIESIHLRSNGG
jgi:hypothetical protein